MIKHSLAAAVAGLMFAGASSLAAAQDAPASLATLSKAVQTVPLNEEGKVVY